MEGHRSFQATLPRTRPLATSLAAVVLGGLMVVAGLAGRTEPDQAASPSAAGALRADRVMELRAVAEAQFLAAPRPGHRMTEAEVLERIAIDEARDLIRPSKGEPLTEAEVLEERELREARELAEQ